jgi:hypothetical protein
VGQHPECMNRVRTVGRPGESLAPQSAAATVAATAGPWRQLVEQRQGISPCRPLGHTTRGLRQSTQRLHSWRISVAGSGPASRLSLPGHHPYPVTTDPEEIAAFLRRRSGPLVVFATYQSSPEIAKAFKLGRVPAFDLAIADGSLACGHPVDDFWQRSRVGDRCWQ